MRDRHAGTETGRAQRLALHQCVEDANLVQAHGLGRSGGQHMQGLPLR